MCVFLCTIPVNEQFAGWKIHHFEMGIFTGDVTLVYQRVKEANVYPVFFLVRKEKRGLPWQSLETTLKNWVETRKITKGLAAWQSLGLILSCNKVLMVNPEKPSLE